MGRPDYTGNVNIDVAAQSINAVNTKEYWNSFEQVADYSSTTALGNHPVVVKTYKGAIIGGHIRIENTISGTDSIDLMYMNIDGGVYLNNYVGFWYGNPSVVYRNGLYCVYKDGAGKFVFGVTYPIYFKTSITIGYNQTVAENTSYVNHLLIGKEV